MKSIKYITRQVQVVFEDPETRKVDACMNVFINGQTAIFHSLLGKNLLRSLVNHIPDILEKLKVDRFLIVVEPSMFKLLNRLIMSKYKEYVIIKLREITLTDKPMYETLVMCNKKRVY